MDIPPSLSLEEVNASVFLVALRAGGAEGRRAFEALVRALHGRLLAYVRRHLGDVEEAQEAVQEVFLAVHRGLTGFEGKSRLTTWIYSLAHHKVCDRIADRARERALSRAAAESGADPAAAEPEEDWSRVTAWGSAPDAVYARVAVERWMAEAVAALEPPGCDVYRLRDVEGLSGEEVALLLGLSHGAVRVQLHRARASIVERVRERMAAGAAGNGARA